jgi:hypothetical protein
MISSVSLPSCRFTSVTTTSAILAAAPAVQVPPSARTFSSREHSNPMPAARHEESLLRKVDGWQSLDLTAAEPNLDPAGMPR